MKWNINRYTNNWEKQQKEQEGLKKKNNNNNKKLDRLDMDKEGSLEWLRRDQLNWDGEQIINNAQG